MRRRARANTSAPQPVSALPKTPTGITGLDEITGGGLPHGRPTLVCGSAGCGKTLLAMEFLVHGATQYGEPGACITFEETEEELAQNVRSLGFDVEALVADKRLAFDHVHVDKREIEETGEYDLEGLFLRLGSRSIQSVRSASCSTRSSRCFPVSPTWRLLRSELRRLFRWLKDKGVTAVITAERGDGTLTRQGLEEYVSDCVILLDHRVHEQLSTRRMRIVKYRGTSHGTNEYPFLIDDNGISVLPVTSIGLSHRVSSERVSSGIPGLDAMLGLGYYRGSSVLVSGTAGSGKSTMSAHLADATCRRGERCLYLAFEESKDQIVRNMRSIGLDLQKWMDEGFLRIESSRPTLHGLEMHLAHVHRLVAQFEPSTVIIDPISNFRHRRRAQRRRRDAARLMDFLKSKGITAMFVNLTSGAGALEATEIGVSSLIDTWIILRDIEAGGERNRGLYVIKSRGMNHSNQIREFMITAKGIDLRDVYVGPEGVLTGSLRAAQEAREKAAAALREHEMQQRQADLDRRRAELQAQIVALQHEVKSVEKDMQAERAHYDAESRTLQEQRKAAALRRGGEPVGT
jgi:circadian clock protein KaiC